MASTGVINGTILRLYFNTTGSTYAVIGNSTEVTFEFTQSVRETSNQDSGGNATFLEGKRVRNITFSALHSEDATVGFWSYYDKLAGSERGLCGGRVNTGVSGDRFLEFIGYVTQLSLTNGGVEGNCAFNGAIQVTGAVTKSTNA